MASKPIKPTKAQLAEAKVRAAASGISMNQSAKGLRNASKAIVAGASMLPAGRAVKAATTASKIAKTAAARRKFNAATERRILDNQVKKSVKVLPRKTAPKTDLSNRGMKTTAEQRNNRAWDSRLNKAERDYDSAEEMRYTGLRSYPKGYEKSRLQGPKGKNLRKRAALEVETKKKLPIKINSQRNLAK